MEMVKIVTMVTVVTVVTVVGARLQGYARRGCNDWLGGDDGGDCACWM
eukprot:COSAG05_NODE_193_length_14574_cov_23.070812_7_plen_48_part_00